jgi:hypothetical protein
MRGFKRKTLTISPCPRKIIVWYMLKHAWQERLFGTTVTGVGSSTVSPALGKTDGAQLHGQHGREEFIAKQQSGGLWIETYSSKGKGGSG